MVIREKATGERGWEPRLGAEASFSGVRFRVWAPERAGIEVVAATPAGGIAVPLSKEREGYFSGFVPGMKPGMLYKYRLDGKKELPDPCSRFQPRGPFGPSMIIDPDEYAWHDRQWQGLRLSGQIFYELHIGAFTPEGTFASAARQLAHLRRLGITAIELLPVNEFSGRWNWGYDGVDLYSVSHNYGDPFSFKRFVDTAHGMGIGVLLDVVYNHLGAEGCYLQEFSPRYFSPKYTTDWGRAINFDDEGSQGVREFFVQNACYWIREYHLDGLRLDATQNIYDAGRPHILSEITCACRKAAGKRGILLIAENEPQDTRCLAPAAKGGYGFDAMWNDDFHHSVRVAATRFREGYFQDYRGSAQELVSLMKRVFLFQGQYCSWQRKARGTRVAAEPSASFVVYLQNHDQIGNQLEGKRLSELIRPSLYRALMTFMMLSPCTPMIFMGQEFVSSAPFPFFADLPDLARDVSGGRREYIAQFPSYARRGNLRRLPHPCRESTFKSAQLDFAQRRSHAPMYVFHRELIALRRRDPVIGLQSRKCIEAAVLAPEAFALRFDGGLLGERLLLVNYGRQPLHSPVGEPLLVPGGAREWSVRFSSDDPAYGGKGTASRLDLRRLRMAAETSLVFEATE